MGILWVSSTEQSEPLAAAKTLARARFGGAWAQAADAWQAWTEWLAGDFALVVVDWTLPAGQAVDLCRRLANESQRADCVVLAWVEDCPLQMEEALEAGADDWLVASRPAAEIGLRMHVAFERYLLRLDRARTRRACEEIARQAEESTAGPLQRRVLRLPVARHRDRDKVLDALEQANGNRTAASRLLGISRATLYRRLHSFGLE